MRRIENRWQSEGENIKTSGKVSGSSTAAAILSQLDIERSAQHFKPSPISEKIAAVIINFSHTPFTKALLSVNRKQMGMSAITST